MSNVDKAFYESKVYVEILMNKNNADCFLLGYFLAEIGCDLSTISKYYFDNLNYVTYNHGDLGVVSWAPLTKEHYLKLNLAMGGIIPPLGGGGPIDYTKFPYTFEIEYARYYKRVP